MPCSRINIKYWQVLKYLYQFEKKLYRCITSCECLVFHDPHNACFH